MIIEKTASIKNNCVKPIYYFNSARHAFKEVLNQYKNRNDFTLLIPNYIGFSPNEGSGIFDPINESNINYKFYALNRQLYINYNELENTILSTSGPKVLLLVHYFGYVDKNIEKIIWLCKRNNVSIIEDAAHALYTDFVDHSCGDLGDYVIYSLHKMLPFSQGGMLKINNTEDNFKFKNACDRYDIMQYDFKKIADIRKRNAEIWDDLLKKYSDEIEILRPYSYSVTPQTFPIIIKNFDRNKLYFKLNENGFGAVSLYHTMIKEIDNLNFTDSLWLSKRIINMPVHQDVEENNIKRMAQLLIKIIGA